MLVYVCNKSRSDRAVYHHPTASVGIVRITNTHGLAPATTQSQFSTVLPLFQQQGAGVLYLCCMVWRRGCFRYFLNIQGV